MAKMESAERVDAPGMETGVRWPTSLRLDFLTYRKGAVRVSTSVVVRPDKIKSRLLAWYLAQERGTVNVAHHWDCDSRTFTSWSHVICWPHLACFSQGDQGLYRRWAEACSLKVNRRSGRAV